MSRSEDNNLKSADVYRDSISTVNKEGKRIWIYPRKPSGFFYNARTVVSIFLLIILFGLPFIKVDGRPLFLFNILERKFILFGNLFGTHDFFIFVLIFIAGIIFIFLFTAVYGRLFCGWICPQTIFMEMVFRKIEYWIEGDAKDQIALNAAPWTAQKTVKKVSKQTIFFGLSFLIGNLFLAYIIGIDELFSIVMRSPAENPGGFTLVMAFTGGFYFVFASFREQACTIVCPYGRLQSVLLDRNSIVVAYDDKRGEPRGKLKKDEVRTEGDCIDCKLCVDVCPTGIDIRNGIQLECVNCTACIDACDDVMEKVGKPKKLIRYDSLNGISLGEKFKITPRIITYTSFLLILLGLIAYLIFSRSDAAVTILRAPGTMYQEQPGGKISNIYSLNIVNKTYDPMEITLTVQDRNAEIKILGENVRVDGQKVYEGRFMLILDVHDIERVSTPLVIDVYNGKEKLKEIKTSFMGIPELKNK
ncbi:MAG: cytochrome c oxidase accessory protein CcoG [Ignavibacteriales bacterium]|nr:MAG: cytochrome c oxidase accessory protein CcoG [Ignavibacteriales bacterium]